MDKILTNCTPWENNYNHFEGNSAAHVKASLMGNSANVFLWQHKTIRIWQSVYFCEFDGQEIDLFGLRKLSDEKNIKPFTRYLHFFLLMWKTKR